MMFSPLEPFLLELSRLKEEFFPGGRIETVYTRLDKVSMRIIIEASLFIDIYFNALNDRFDFTLIDSGRRIFGYDNLKSWHCHPYSNSEEHVECDHPSLRQMMQETASVIAMHLKD